MSCAGNERLADMHCYDFETNHWSEVDCTSGDAPSGRSSLVAQVYENCLYIFGGKLIELLLDLLDCLVAYALVIFKDITVAQF